MSDNDKKKYTEGEAKDWYGLTHQNWRSWGSWFSWGSPVGLALFFSIPMIAFGIMYWLIHN